MQNTHAKIPMGYRKKTSQQSKQTPFVPRMPQVQQNNNIKNNNGRTENNNRKNARDENVAVVQQPNNATLQQTAKPAKFSMIYASGRQMSLDKSDDDETIARLKLFLSWRNIDCIVYRGKVTLQQLLQSAQNKYIRSTEESIVFFAYSNDADMFFYGIDNPSEGSSRLIATANGNRIVHVDQGARVPFLKSPVYQELLKPKINSELFIIYKHDEEYAQKHKSNNAQLKKKYMLGVTSLEEIEK
jgi:hypothetical protein